MACSAILAFAFLQNTWVVDDGGGPGVNFTDIPPAVAAAADGDILLVQPGTYSHFTLSGKGLRILGSGSSSTLVQNTASSLSTTISNLPASSLATVDRLRFTRPSPNNGGVLVEVLGSTTQVALADVDMQGLGAETALRIDAAAVWVFRSTVTGGGGSPSFSSAGGAGLVAQAGAFVHVSASTLTGGSAMGPGGLCTGTLQLVGGRGAWIQGGSEVWIAESDVLGGNGACCAQAGCDCSGGGTAIYVQASTARVSGGPSTLIRGGDAGCITIDFTPCFNLFPGTGISATLGSTVFLHNSVDPLPGSCGVCLFTCTPVSGIGGSGIQTLLPPLPVLDVSGNLTLSGGSATLSLADGPPGAPFFVGATGVLDHVDPGPLFVGEFLVDPTAVFPFWSGLLSGTGSASLTIPLAGLPASFAYFPFHFQGIALDPGGTFWRLSNSTVATLRP